MNGRILLHFLAYLEKVDGPGSKEPAISSADSLEHFMKAQEHFRAATSMEGVYSVPFILHEFPAIPLETNIVASLFWRSKKMDSSR